MERELPTGTVTFLFTDIEESTMLLDELGAESYADALAEHRRIIRETGSRNGGVEVDTQGDSFFLAFHTAPAALEAATEAQRALAPGPIQVRMGIHTGTPHVAAEGYVGMDVHRAARIAAAAHGGQVVVSSATAELVDPARLRDLGEHRLKDLTRSQRLHQLVGDGLASDFPPLRTLDRRTTNLPVQAAPLVGRERELGETQRLLRSTHLLTLTGPGGTGKTRLAIQLAADVLDEFEDGVYFVDLSDVGDIRLVAPAVAQTLDLQERGGRDLSDEVAAFVAGKNLLFVLDNVERVIEAGPDLSRWLEAAPQSKILATSRIPFRVGGEQEFPVPPLAGDAAVELFAERARAVRPDFVLNGDVSVVAEICTRLDALPLAIELAAARVKLLPPVKLLERLDQRLPVLTGGARDAPERHRTLRATIDWSFDLLDADEQELVARLSVFAGGSTLEAAEAVCDATIDGLASLVEKSLLGQREDSRGAPRFSLLETVREYAHEQLEARGEAHATAERHARYVLSLTENASQGGPEEDPELGRKLARTLMPERDNLRAALGWLVTTDDNESELRLATTAFWALWNRASLRELKAWIDAALERSAGVDSGLRADALGAAALAAANLGESELAREYARASLVLARERGDKRQIEWGLRVLSFDEPDPEERRRLLLECERLSRELGNDAALAWVIYLRGMALFDEGNLDQARLELESAASIFDKLGRQWDATNANLSLAVVLIAADRVDDAGMVVDSSLGSAVELDSAPLVTEALVLRAALELERDPAVAAQLLSGAYALSDRAGQPLEINYVVPLADATRERAQSRLRESFEREWDAGSALTLEEALELVRRLS